MATTLFKPGDPDALYIVDLSGYVFRAYHAITPLNTPSGEPTQAVLGTVNMLELLVRERQPSMLAVAMDSRRKTFRKEIYPEYKANRPPPPEDLKHQMARCEEIVRAFSIPIYKQEGVEADDLIATAVLKAREQNLKVVIVSADKDLMQLVGDDVIMWDTMRDRVFGPEEVQRRFGVAPTQVRDLLALMGDSSDNIPGVPSVGPKTARDLLTEHGDLAGVFANLDSIKRKKLRETLTEHQQAAELSQQLVTLKSDCDLGIDISKLRYGGRDIDTLRQLYSELGFTRHLNNLENDPENTGTTSGEEIEDVDYEIVTDAAGVTKVVEALASAEEPAVLAYSANLNDPDALTGIAIAVSPGRAFYVAVHHRYVGAPARMDAASLEPLSRALQGRAIATYDGKRTALALHHVGVTVDVQSDIDLMSYVVSPEAAHTLPAVVERETGQKTVPLTTLLGTTKKTRRAIDELEVGELGQLTAQHADFTLRSAARLKGRLDEHHVKRVYRDIEQPLLPLLAEMERRGVLVDPDHLKVLGKQLETRMLELESRAHEVAGREFNVNSPRQLEALLFDDLGLKPIKRTKTSRSTDAATLEALSTEHELPRIILEHRQLSKLKGTYIDALPLLINPRTGRIHTEWGQTVAATGRLSSSDPNLQNIPIRSEIGRDIRAAFVAPPGHLLVSGDYSQIELRVLAHLSEDPVLIEAFQAGQDIHLRTAMEIFDLAESEVTKEHRSRAKAVNFGVIYGQGESGLAKSLGIKRSDARNFISTYFDRYAGVRRFMDSTLDKARAGGVVRTLFGRQRLVPDLQSGNRSKRMAAERITMNTPIQGTAADLMKLAMLACREPITPGAKLVLTVHDELVFEVPKSEVEAAQSELHQRMENVYEMRVPLVVDVGSGATWNTAH